jgi:hypothetical protein
MPKHTSKNVATLAAKVLDGTIKKPTLAQTKTLAGSALSQDTRRPLPKRSKK